MDTLKGQYIAGEYNGFKIKTFKDKDNNEQKEYKIEVVYKGGSFLISTREHPEEEKQLQKGNEYIFPVGVRAFAYNQNGNLKGGYSNFLRDGEITEV